MEILFAAPQHLEPWMALVRSVRLNFPGLETEEGLSDYERTVQRFMGKQQALCAMEGDTLCGVLLFSRGHNMICCLAVAPAHRRKGAASALLTCALAELDRTRPVTVSTFREGDDKAPAPRALYRKFGFLPDALVVENGYPNQVFVLPPL